MDIALHDERLAALSRELRPGKGECPFVVSPPHDATTTLAHCSAGRDATFVVLDSSKPAAVMIGYAPFVEGTALIYDVTDETLQGKARPFECQLRPRMPRIYALLPVQIESISLAQRGQRLTVKFCDARGERIQAALPFVLTLTMPSAKKSVDYSCTDRDGRFVRSLDNVAGREPVSVSVRSLLTGRAELVQLRG